MWNRDSRRLAVGIVDGPVIACTQGAPFSNEYEWDCNDKTWLCPAKPNGEPVITWIEEHGDGVAVSNAARYIHPGLGANADVPYKSSLVEDYEHLPELVKGWSRQ